MGELYQATDSKFGRSAAIKLLPEAITHDTDPAARFGREARELASLNHPNIAAIHGIEPTWRHIVRRIRVTFETTFKRSIDSHSREVS